MKRVTFIINGNGYGHVTQALAFRDIIHTMNLNYSVVSILYSGTQNSHVYHFLKYNFPFSFISNIQSFEFAFSKSRNISLTRTLFRNLKQLPAIKKSQKEIAWTTDKINPDLLVNFYEPSYGIYKIFNNDNTPSISVGHQFMLEHPTYCKKDAGFIQLSIYSILNYITGYGTRKIALSLYDANDLEDSNIYVCPPLLRSSVYSGSLEKEYSILVYLNSTGYLEELKTWCRQNQYVKVNCFWTGKFSRPLENLTLHPLDDQMFLTYLKKCSIVASNAGFDLIAESVYLGKKIMIVPIPNHLEHQLNAIDAAKHCGVIINNSFNLDKIANYLETDKRSVISSTFKSFVDKNKHKIIDLLPKK